MNKYTRYASTRITEEVFEKLEKLSKKRKNIRKSDIIREAIEEKVAQGREGK
jgi:predicted DNA-binding protein